MFSYSSFSFFFFLIPPRHLQIKSWTLYKADKVFSSGPGTFHTNYPVCTFSMSVWERAWLVCSEHTLFMPAEGWWVIHLVLFSSVRGGGGERRHLAVNSSVVLIQYIQHVCIKFIKRVLIAASDPFTRVWIPCVCPSVTGADMKCSAGASSWMQLWCLEDCALRFPLAWWLYAAS